MTAPQIAALFCRADSIYRSLPGVDVWDQHRDARTWSGGAPIVAHPPCRAWGNLSYFANPAPGELELAPWAVDQARQWGGVVEHPLGSRLWKVCGIPTHGHKRDAHGGWLLRIKQSDWGHRAEKDTGLYIVGLDPAELPPVPLVLGRPTHVVIARSGTRKEHPGWRPHLRPAEREATPPELAAWIVEVLRRIAAKR
jgi:hypothetical protein